MRWVLLLLLVPCSAFAGTTASGWASTLSSGVEIPFYQVGNSTVPNYSVVLPTKEWSEFYTNMLTPAKLFRETALGERQAALLARAKLGMTPQLLQDSRQFKADFLKATKH